MALETVPLRKLSLSEPNVFRGCDDKKTRENEKKIGVADIKQHSLCNNHKQFMLKRFLFLSDVKYHFISVKMLI